MSITVETNVDGGDFSGNGRDIESRAAIATFLLLLATGASLLLVKLTGYNKMTSTQEGL